MKKEKELNFTETLVVILGTIFIIVWIIICSYNINWVEETTKPDFTNYCYEEHTQYFPECFKMNEKYVCNVLIDQYNLKDIPARCVKYLK